jgi:GNAT superfamily N-acetyltransferase
MNPLSQERLRRPAVSPAPAPVAAPSPLSLRRATLADVERLVEMNHAAYPDLVEENVVYDASMIRSHLDAYPEGQLVATRDGRIVGALSTLIVRGKHALARHTWTEITADGRFTDHDPDGDTLYLADIYVDPQAWGTRVGPFLYDALKALCRQQGLARVVAGGRMWSFGQFAGTAEQYVEAVKRGEVADRVLTSQLKAGFQVRGILPGYLHDARSRSSATLLEWVAE